MSSAVWLVDPKRSPVGYWFVYTCGILQFFAAGALVFSGRGATELALAGVLVLSAALFVSVAGLLGARKGGACFEPSRQEIVLFGRNENDRVAFPLAGLTGLKVVRREEYWGRSQEPVFVCSVELATSEGLSVLLLETPTLDDAHEAALMFRQATRLDVLGDPAPQTSDPPSQPIGIENRPDFARGFVGAGKSKIEDPLALRTGPRWALSSTLLLLALFCLVSGVLLLAGLRETGVLGFLFGPVAVTLGVLLLALWLYKALGAQHVLVSPGSLEHTYHMGPLSWGRRTLSFDKGSPSPTVRLRSRGSQGFSLEVISGGEVAVIGSGATTSSRLTPRRLLELAVIVSKHHGM